MAKQSKRATMPKEHSTLFGASGGFKSITNQQLDKTRQYCSNLVEEKYDGNYTSRALRSMIGTIMGSFDLLEAKLIRDYNKALKRLKFWQKYKIKKAGRTLKSFEQTVAHHEAALERYRDNIAIFTDRQIGHDLSYSESELQTLKKRFNQIEEKKHEA